MLDRLRRQHEGYRTSANLVKQVAAEGRHGTQAAAQTQMTFFYLQTFLQYNEKFTFLTT